jgi:hypothetical protein
MDKKKKKTQGTKEERSKENWIERNAVGYRETEEDSRIKMFSFSKC